MSRKQYIEPPIDSNYEGPMRKCSCGCGEIRPLTHDYFATLTVIGPTRTYKYLHYQRRVCRNFKKREYDKNKKEL
jgi:hypothetical protein